MVTCYRRINKLRCLKNRHSLVPSLAQQARATPSIATTIDKMIRLKILCFLICLLGFIGPIHGADKYTDENRPYEFGFTIDGEQHRHEKKDENGIIMGEFGFITADGVYHVTVYATDENGRFKILSMKNIRVKPYPTAGGNVKKGHSIPFPASENAPVLQGPSKTAQHESKSVELKKQISSPAKSCSHCSLPTTTTRAPPPQLTDIAIVSRDKVAPSFSGVTASNIYQQNSDISSSTGQSYGQRGNDIDQRFPASNSGQQNNLSNPSFTQNNPKYQQGNSQQNRYSGENYQQQDFSGNPNSPPSLNYPQQNSNIPQTNQYDLQNGNNFNQNNPQVEYNGPQKNPQVGYNGPQKNLQVGYNGPQNNPQVGYSGPQNKPQVEYSGPQNNPQVGYNDPQNNPQVGYNGLQNNPQDGVIENQYNPQTATNKNQYYPQQIGKTDNNYPQTLIQPHSTLELPNNIQTPKDTLRNPKQYNDISAPFTETGLGAALASLNPQTVSDTPTLLAAQMQIVPKDTDIHHRNPGEEEGLPNGLSKDDLTNLLYTFNYTVGFHGHHEEGYSNGAKKGYYYVTGRNGVRTRVDYIADENGFRPRISQEVLDILSDDVPKPETEKDEKFGLKGYEFKWLYYPADEKKL